MKIRMKVIESTSLIDCLSLRLLDEDDKVIPPTSRDIGLRRSLKKKGFKPGDIVELILVARSDEHE